MKNKNKWAKRAFLRIIIYTVAASVGIIFFALFMSFILSRFTWHADNPIYQILIRIRDYLELCILLTMMFSFLCILYFELKKAYDSLNQVMEAIDQIDDKSTDLIQLDNNELKEINDKLNQTKMKIQFNERAAKEAEQRKNDLVIYLAHDLKTPLTSVIGYLTLLKDEKEISTQLREHYLTVTLDKALRLEDLINEFFEITRFNLTQQALELSRIDMSRLLEQLTYEFQPMLDEKNLKCHLDIPKQLEMKCDVNKMQRVLDNLLRNAVNYSFENSEIDITLKKEDENIWIVFENQGNTIPKEKLDHIFEQFFRLDSSRTSRTGGAGLGLSIAKAIVEQHQGTIAAKSYDEKIIFEIMIPVL